jgi:hypothetical protein
MNPAIKGFATSPLVASIPIPAVLDGSFNHYLDLEVWALVLPFSYASALLLGLPTYLLLRNRIPYTAINLSIAGTLIATISLLAILGFRIEASLFLLMFSASGTLGGFVFWFITRKHAGYKLSLSEQLERNVLEKGPSEDHFP